jgi:hypothetical protein
MRRLAMLDALVAPLLVVSLLAATACGGDRDPRQRPCAPHLGQPLRGGVVQRTLSRFGFDLRRLERCDTTTVDYLQNRAEHRDAQGYVICTVARRPIRRQGRLFPEPTILHTPGEEPNFFFENVRCAVYVRGDDPHARSINST